MSTGTWWVGGYIEAGMGTSGASKTPYLPFVFQDASAADAKAHKGGGAVLLAGPFATQADAQGWANAYEKNPSTLHAGSGLTPSTGTVQGDNPPAAVSGVFAIFAPLVDFFGALTQANTYIRLAKVVIGGTLLIVGLVHITGADNAVANAARKVPLPI